MNRLLFSLLCFFVSLNYASATLCMGLSAYTDPNDGSTNHLLLSYTTFSDYSSAPNNIWNSQLFTLKWDQALGANAVTGLSNQAIFPYALDGAAVLDGGSYYQKISSSSTNLIQNIGNGATLNVVVITVSAAAAGATFEIDPFPPMAVTGGNISANNVLGEQIDVGGPTCPATASIPLPLELLSFDAQVLSSAVLLEWTSISEIDFWGFELERSTDDQQYGAIAELEGGAREGAYTYLDEKVTPGINYYYRLKMLDLDGSFRYSNIQTARLDDDAQWIAYPNPVQHQLQLDIQSDFPKTIVFKLQNISGQLLIEQQYDANKGLNKVMMDLAAIPNGTYLLSANDGIHLLTRKIVVLH